MIKPTLNSTAENIRKKNVRESKFMLSYVNPIKRATTYRVIHNNSAVNRRCNEVDMFINKLDSSKKKKISKTFKSPKNIIN